MFDSYYDYNDGKQNLYLTSFSILKKKETLNLNVAQGEEKTFSARNWISMSEKEQQETLMNYRIAYLGETMVNWCPGLGTVLANDEVVDGVSERGGYPVVQKKMKQWCLRVSAYAQPVVRLFRKCKLDRLYEETQRNWIGRSEGTEVVFKSITPTADNEEIEHDITIFTTRADTMFGVTFMVLAPESELVPELTTAKQKSEVEEYLAYVKKRTERDRMTDRKVTGVFTGSYGINPLTDEKLPIYISEYVLSGYGQVPLWLYQHTTVAIMQFAKHFNLPIRPLIEGADVSEESFDAKEVSLSIVQ